MVVELINGVEITASIKQGYAILKDTYSAESEPSFVLFPDSTDIWPMFLDGYTFFIERFKLY